MLKKFTAVLLSSFMVVLSIPFIKSNADTLVIPEDDTNHYYVYNHINFDEWTYDDLLTVDNYNDYYDALSGSQKNDVNKKFPDYHIDSGVINSLLEPSYQSTQNRIFFRPIVINGETIPFEDCDASVWITQAGSLLACSLFYNPNGDEIVSSANYNYSDTQFYISFVSFSIEAGGYVDDKYYYKFAEYQNVQATAQYDSTNQIYYNYTYDNNYVGPLYDTRTCLFTSSTFTDINTPEKAYKEYKNGSSLSIDRRTSKFLDKINGGGNNPTIDSNLGVIGGSFDCLLSADSLNNQKLLVVYDLNNYTKQIKNTINLKLNYQFFCDGQYKNNDFTFDGNFVDSVGYPDSYNVNYSNYVTIDINKVFNNIYGSDLIAGDFGLDTIFQIGNQVNFNQNFYTANEFINSIMKIGGFSLSTRKNVDYYNNRSFWDNVADTVIDFLNYGFTEKSLQFNYNTTKETVFNDCYLLVTMYLENEENNSCSDSFIYKYNYLDGTVTNVGGFEDDTVFSGNYPTTNSGSATYPSNNTGYGGSAYGGSAYGGSGGSASASTGDIYVYPGMTSLPYLLVDIPEDEWINKTPNLKTIFTDFKDTLSEIKEDSILNVMSETYNYIPVPMWQYLTYGVSILLAIGIWRGITRR